MQKAKDKGVNLVLAVDAKIADAFSNDANTKFCPVNEIPDGWEVLTSVRNLKRSLPK